MKNRYEIDRLISPIAKKYGFKKEKYSPRFWLDKRFELKTSTGNQVGSEKLEFELSDATKRYPGCHWGGYISELQLDYSFDNNIILSTFGAWMQAIFELEEMQPYTRSLKIKKLKKNK